VIVDCLVTLNQIDGILKTPNVFLPFVLAYVVGDALGS